jgi:response regulator RpfG family c-di-GMP phosphodiesterase
MKTFTPKPNVLIVDDKAQHLFTIARLLKKLDVRVVQATSGSEALGLTLEHNFFLAIVDVQMPEMSGYELVELWRGNPSTTDLPVIFISGIRTDEYQHRETFNTGGAVDFLGKPFLPEILLAKVRVFIELYQHKLKLRELVDELQAQRNALARVTRELEQARSALSKRAAVVL